MVKKIFWFFSILFLVGVFLAPQTDAAQFKGGEDYTLRSRDKVSENLYVAGSSVSIEGGVEGDLLAIGGVVSVAGPISGDVIITGGTVNIFSEIKGDLRVAGGNITIGSHVEGEVAVAGGSLRVTSGAVFEKDAFLVGGSIITDGIIKGNLTTRGGELVIGGVVEKDVSSKMSGNVRLEDGANIIGNLNYQSLEEVEIGREAKIGGVITYDKMVKKGRAGAGGLEVNMVLGILVNILTLLVVGLALYYIFKKDSEKIIKESLEQPGRKFIIGLVVLITLPIAAIISFFSVVGAPLGVSALFLYGAFFVQGIIYSGIVFGSALHRLIIKKGDVLSWKTVVVGIILLSLIKWIPILGWIISFIFFLIAFGSILELMLEKFRNR